MATLFREFQHGYNHFKNLPAAHPRGISPLKPTKVTLFSHDFVRFRKQHSRYKIILPSFDCFVTVVLWSILHLSHSSEPVLRLDYQTLSPLPTLLAVSASEPTVFGFPIHHVLSFQIYILKWLVWALVFVCTGHWNF